MRIALAQLNFHVGNFEFNTSKIIDAIRRSKSEKADLIVFTELSVCGYTPFDLLDYPAFIKKCIAAVELIAKECIGIAAIVGAPSVNSRSKGKNLHNSAYFLADGVVQEIRHKAALPDYDIFDEYRYFEPGTDFHCLQYKNKTIAVPICEDLWNEHTYALPQRYSKDEVKMYAFCPMDELYKEKPDFILNISASPFAYDHAEERKENFKKVAAKYKLPVFFLNQVGANTDIIFDGGSLVLNADGEIADELNYFAEDFRIYEIESSGRIKTGKPSGKTMLSVKSTDKPERIYQALVLGIRDYFTKMGFKKAIVGSSGGIDSALVLTLACEALGKENVRSVSLPSRHSSDHSLDDAAQLAINLGCGHEVISIEEAFIACENTLSASFRGLPSDTAEENIQARIRAILLMALSNKFGYVLLNTSNKSEAATGYGTLYGDMAGGLAVLGDVYKTEVYELARFINRNSTVIPENIIHKAPSAELRPGQKDSDSLPDYDMLDKVLFRYIELRKSPNEIITEGFEEKTVWRIIHLVNKNEYKRRQSPPLLRVSKKAFNTGRKMPLVAHFF